VKISLNDFSAINQCRQLLIKVHHSHFKLTYGMTFAVLLEIISRTKEGIFSCGYVAILKFYSRNRVTT
jgi:hypothetical protein